MRTLSGMILAGLIGLTTGCGKSDSPATPATPPADPNKPEPAPPKDDPNKQGTTPAPTAGWEMDPAKHAIPTGPVAGKLHGAAFQPDVQIETDALRFRAVSKDGLPVGPAIELRLTDPSRTVEGLRLTVKPDQPAGPDVPVVILTNPPKPGQPPEQPQMIDKGYALTLEVGKRHKGKVPGKIHLSLPGDAKDFLAGTFVADWVRRPNEAPGPDDAPFIQGKIAIVGATEPNAAVAYVRVDPHDPVVFDLIGTVLKPGNPPAKSEQNRPRVAVLIPGATAKDPARYELTKLEPGRYWVFATIQGGPASWKWMDVPAGGQITADFTIAAGVSGGLEVTAPGSAEVVSVLPAAEPGKPWPEMVVVTAASLVGLRAETAAGGKADPAKPVTVTFPRLAPGKYQVWAGDLTGTAEVKAGQTAKVELKKK